MSCDHGMANGTCPECSAANALGHDVDSGFLCARCHETGEAMKRPCPKAPPARKKRTIEVRLVLETDLDDEQLTEICMQTTHDFTKRAEGRCVIAVGNVPEPGATTLWAKLKMPEKPKPGADVIWRPK